MDFHKGIGCTCCTAWFCCLFVDPLLLLHFFCLLWTSIALSTFIRQLQNASLSEEQAGLQDPGQVEDSRATESVHLQRDGFSCVHTRTWCFGQHCDHERVVCSKHCRCWLAVFLFVGRRRKWKTFVWSSFWMFLIDASDARQTFSTVINLRPFQRSQCTD